MRSARVCPSPGPRPLQHRDTVGALPSLSQVSHSSRSSAVKKLSHPGPVPKLSFDGTGDDHVEDFGSQAGCQVTESLESAVRKMSRTSPNRSPNRLDTSGVRGGLSTLARGYETYREGLQLLRPTEFGEASSDDLSSEWETSDVENNNKNECRHLPLPPTPVDRPAARSKPSGWRKVRNMVQWTPFIQTYKKRKYPWVQLAGHSGNFKAGTNNGTVLKKLSSREEDCYKLLMKDPVIREFVPQYYQTVTFDDDEEFIELQDCLSDFPSPSIMDCKIGVRTYLEDELAKAREKPKLRKDMYEKMVAVDPAAPTDEEHRLKGVTKPRYMVWRETISSTATLGFRIEGIKKENASTKDFKTTKSKEQVTQSFKTFLLGHPDAAAQYLQKLQIIKKSLQQSSFFKSHEFIGSSLLFVHDLEKANIWLIDFGKTVPLPLDLLVDHKSAWEADSHEDGYLIGLDNIINIFQQLNNNSESLAAPDSGDSVQTANNQIIITKNDDNQIQ